MRLRPLTDKEAAICQRYWNAGWQVMMLVSDGSKIRFGRKKPSGMWQDLYLYIGLDPDRPFADMRRCEKYRLWDLIRKGVVTHE